MIPAAALAFISRWLQPALLVALVTTSATCFWLHFQNQGLRTAAAEHEAEIMQHIAAGEAAARAVEAEWREKYTLREMEHAEQAQAGDRALRAALNRVRVAEAAAARRPAEEAPATCSGYDAPPSQLSAAHREFLVRLGAEADDVVRQLQLCQGLVVIH